MQRLVLKSLLLSVILCTAANGYLASHGFLQFDRCEIFDDTAANMPYGTGHPEVKLMTPDRAFVVPTPDQWTGNTISAATGFPTYHKGQLGDSTWYITDGVYQAMVVVGDNGLVLVDAPPTIGVDLNAGPFGNASTNKTIVEVVAEISPLPIKKMVYSHIHMDHIGAAGVVKEAYPDVKIIAHKETARQLQIGSRDPRFASPVTVPIVPLPTKTFTNKLNVKLPAAGKKRLIKQIKGNKVVIRHVRNKEVVLRLEYFGSTSVPGNVFIYEPDAKVLMLVDVVYPRSSPFYELGGATNLPLYIAAHDIALSYDFDYFLSGHLSLANRADIVQSQQYIQDILVNAQVALNPFDPLDSPMNDIIGLSGPTFFGTFVDAAFVPGPGSYTPDTGAALGIYGQYLNQLACKCANLTLNPATTPSGVDWRTQFSSVDTNTVGHCLKMALGLIIDPGFKQ